MNDTPSAKLTQYEEGCGRQFNGKKVTQYQLRRHVSWMKSHGVLKVAAKAKAAKAGAR
jgi:hypothetical protein